MAKKRAQKKGGKKRKSKKLKAFAISRQFWKDNWIGALIILLAAVALYSMTLNYEYVLDDTIVITKNDFTKRGVAGIKDIFSYDSFQGYFGEQKVLLQGARYRPLSIASFALEYELVGGLNRKLSHFLNGLFYGLLCLIIYRVSHIIFARDKKRKWYGQISFWATVLFLFHPVHVEAVANIKGRDEIMVMMGAMGALYYAFKYREKAHWAYMLAAALAYFLGLLAKENAITFLAVIPIALWFFGKRGKGKIAYMMGALVATTAIYLAIRIEAIGFLFTDQIASSDLMNDPFKGMTEADKYATIFYTLGKYLRLLVFPHPLSHDYYPYAIPRMHWGNLWVLLSLLAHVAIGVAGLRSMIKKPNVFGFLAIFYLATLSIVSNLFVPVGTFMNERFLFVSSLAYCMLLPYLAIAYIPRKLRVVPSNYNTIALAVLGLIATLYLVKSIDRIPVWKNPLTLNRAAVAVSENSARANCFLATAIYNQVQAEEMPENDRMALLEEAMGYLNHSLSIYPRYSNSQKMKAGVAAEIFKYDNDLNKLLNTFREVARVRPDLTYLKEYLEYLNRRGMGVMQLKDFYYDIGFNYYGNEQFSRENLKYAVGFLQLGLDLDPGDQRLRRALGMVYQKAGDNQRAMQFLN